VQTGSLHTAANRESNSAECHWPALEILIQAL